MLHTDNILILAPHTDDGELGCGASVAKYTAAGKQVTYAAFSTCRQSLPDHLPPDRLAVECKEATNELGIQVLTLFDFEVRRFSYSRQEILEELLRLDKTLNPQTVFMPAKEDRHQDHQVIYAEAMRAFKNANLLGYELPWNNTNFAPAYFETLEACHVQAKQKALGKYGTQAHRRYMQPVFAEALARVRGVQCGTGFAEAFELYRLKS